MENKTKIKIQNKGDKKKCLFREITYCVMWNDINGDIFAIVMNKTIVLKIIY